jgi:hypothetical protein
VTIASRPFGGTGYANYAGDLGRESKLFSENKKCRKINEFVAPANERGDPSALALL